MNFLKKLFLGIALNSLTILLCQKLFNELFNDFYFQGTFIELILLALIISFLNLLIKPILRLIFLPLIWITLGLFSLIINIIILKTATVFMPVLIIQSPIVWLIASIIISSFNSLMYK
ncbi:MAG: phage holin family protein [Candidatus Pacebacteria bacterium]|jgi:putative membrane protein|nr:phage holin family protein [Candidatus Paceibacterota bacterium]MDD4994552.1 phage holin family protein [Candidatus Paceibacterota bacterium]MDD5535246.1 phage holin family protein [Candidatus Paceibacterota bacterium]